MFFQLLRFEIKDRVMRLSTAVYFLLFASLSFLMGITFAGAFKGASVSFGLSNKLSFNSPLPLFNLISLTSFFGLLVVAPIFGQSINKDFENKFSQILFATPLKKATYFWVRFLGSFVSSLLIMTAMIPGLWLASLMPFIDRSLIIEQHAWYYLAPYFVIVIPNILIFGSVFIAVISYFKKMAPVYVASIAVFTGWLISNGLMEDMENKTRAALLDPIGLTAALVQVRYWSVSEQSTQTVPMAGLILQNRLIWSGVGLLFLVAAYLFFNPFRLPKEKKKVQADNEKSPLAFAEVRLPAVEVKPSSLKVLLGLAWFEFKAAFSNIYFLMILICGLLHIVSVAGIIGKMFGTETWPVTYQVLEIIGGNFSLFMVILTTYYAGELVWRDRDQHFYELVDSKPVSNGYLYLSKLASMIFLQVFLLTVVMVACVLIQTFKGYYNYEWNIYFKDLYVYTMVEKVMICIFVLFVQSVTPHKYIGHSIVILYYIALGWIPNLGFDHLLYLLGDLPRPMFSDMNRFGPIQAKYAWVSGYWLLFYFALAVVTLLIWRRGAVQGFKPVISEASRRIRPVHKAAIGVAIASWIAVGAFIFYNTNVVNEYHTPSEIEANMVAYEKTYKAAWDRKDTLQVKGIDVKVDIFPEQRRLYAEATLAITNHNSAPVSQVFVNTQRDFDLEPMEWSHPAKIVVDDQKLHVKIYEFTPAIQPGENLTMKFKEKFEAKGFNNGEFSKIVLANGTMLHGHNFVPAFGYVADAEIAEEKTRRKYGLPERPRIYDVNDKWAIQRGDLGGESSWVDFRAEVSTSGDQTAIAPGYLEKQWTEDGRNHFIYKMDRPMANLWAIMSGRYKVMRDKWHGVDLEIYYHPSHTADLDRMMSGMKKSFDYYTQNFSPFQFRQLRIIEFPRYERYAQSLPNTVPFSEAIGFILRVRPEDPESVDVPFYVTSHEVAHQWWGHQIQGAPVQGSAMLVESLAQYSALMVQEHEYGAKTMRRFLKYELDRYLEGRGRETKKEMPLSLTEGQMYVHYRKGSMVFYALKDYLGEDVVNGVLRDFLKEHAFETGPYSRAVDLVERFRKVAPPEKQYLISDLFDKITFYDNRTETVEVKKEGDKFHVTLKGQSSKFHADDQGRETAAEMNDFVDVGLYDEKGEPIYLNKHKLHAGANTVEVVVDRAPFRGGFDPVNKLIDRVSDDNLIKVTTVQ